MAVFVFPAADFVVSGNVDQNDVIERHTSRCSSHNILGMDKLTI